MVGSLAQLKETYPHDTGQPAYNGIYLVVLMSDLINRARSGSETRISMFTSYGQAGMVKTTRQPRDKKLEWSSSRMEPPITDDNDGSPEDPRAMLSPSRDIFWLLSTSFSRIGKQYSCLSLTGRRF